MKLKKLNEKFIRSTLKHYEKDGEHLLNNKLLKLFKTFNDESDKSETRIKVAALNTLYSTAIKNINPVVTAILKASSQNQPKRIDEYVEFVDLISVAKWKNKNTGISYERNNLSFASKYVHFLSKARTPIYDSYIWIIIKGYLGQNGLAKKSFTKPKNYQEFYSTFSKFKSEFNLNKFSNYELDKFLWQYGRMSIAAIEEELGISIDKAKSELQRRIKIY